MPATTALVTALILERPLCISCIATKAGEPSAASLEASMERIRHVVELHHRRERCRAGGALTIVYAVDRRNRWATRHPAPLAGRSSSSTPTRTHSTLTP